MTLKCDGGCKKLCTERYFQNRFVSLKICGGIILFLPLSFADFRQSARLGMSSVILIYLFVQMRVLRSRSSIISRISLSSMSVFSRTSTLANLPKKGGSSQPEGFETARAMWSPSKTILIEVLCFFCKAIRSSIIFGVSM